MKQAILSYDGRFFNDWLEEKNKEGWKATQIIHYTHYITGDYSCVILFTREVSANEKEII